MKMSYRYHHDDDELDEEWLIISFFVFICGTYWGIVHLIDKFTFNIMPWWVEPFTAFPLVGLLALIEIFGRNPLYWWPLFWGTKIKIRQEDDPLKHTLEIEEVFKRMGGRANVYVIDYDTLKFRKKKDVVRYWLFKS